MRIHLAQLLPGSIIKIHRDHGGYTVKAGADSPHTALDLWAPVHQ